MDVSDETVDDVIDFDEFEENPAFAAALRDAEERSSLRVTLIEQRKASGMTQREVADVMGTTQSAISDVEGGASDPHLSTYQRYARAVGARVIVRCSIDTSHSAVSAEGK